MRREQADHRAMEVGEAGRLGRAQSRDQGNEDSRRDTPRIVSWHAGQPTRGGLRSDLRFGPRLRSPDHRRDGPRCGSRGWVQRR
jgi:hypothetical protein